METLLNAKILGRLLRYALFGAIAWLGATIVTAGVQSLRVSGKAAATIGEYERIRNEAGQTRSGTREHIQTLIRNNLFVPAPDRAKILTTQAILGDAVLIGDRWYRAGQTVQDFEIVEVGADFVTIRQEDKEHRLSPFDVKVNDGRSSSTSSSASGGTSDRERESPGTDRGSMRGRGGPGSSMMMGMRDRIESMTPEQRQELFERFRNASPEERERMREEYMRGRD